MPKDSSIPRSESSASFCTASDCGAPDSSRRNSEPGSDSSAFSGASLLAMASSSERPTVSQSDSLRNEAGSPALPPVDWKTAVHDSNASEKQNAVINMYVGKNKKKYSVPMAILQEKSPYFRELRDKNVTLDQRYPVPENTFQDLDPFSMTLFMHWLSIDRGLRGPRDYHSLSHYLGLYALARKVEIEGLQNEVMDYVRQYYREQRMTASPYRLEYIYTHTEGPCPMRTFLVSTVAYRVLVEQPQPEIRSSSTRLMWDQQPFLSDSMKAILTKNPEMAGHLMEELIRLHRNGELDARRGPDCAWHVHDNSKKCAVEMTEVWQKDGTS